MGTIFYNLINQFNKSGGFYEKYDYLVIGSGAANITTDAAIDAGKKVAIIEKAKFAGTCLNRGCIPTKL